MACRFRGSAVIRSLRPTAPVAIVGESTSMSGQGQWPPGPFLCCPGPPSEWRCAVPLQHWPYHLLTCVEGDNHVFPHQQVSGSPDSILYSIEGEPELNWVNCSEVKCFKPWPHSQSRCRMVSGALHPKHGQMRFVASPHECIATLTRRISWANIHDRSLYLFWRVVWVTFFQTCLASPIVSPRTGLTGSRSCTRVLLL